MTTLREVKKNQLILEFIKQSKNTLQILKYTDHGLNHANLVAERARRIAGEIGFSKRDQELSEIAGFLHDFANFLSRDYHHYLGSVLFINLFEKDFSPDELIKISQAIVNHDKFEMKFSSPITACLILADKSHTHRDRVLIKNIKEIKTDIHNRVNFAVTKSYIKVNKAKKVISLILKIDTNFIPVIEYFEIFTERMIFCRKAAKYLGYKFGLVINNFKLL